MEKARDDAVRVVICARPRADIVSSNALSVDHPSRPWHARAERPAHHPGARQSKCVVATSYLKSDKKVAEYSSMETLGLKPRKNPSRRVMLPASIIYIGEHIVSQPLRYHVNVASDNYL